MQADNPSTDSPCLYKQEKTLKTPVPNAQLRNKDNGKNMINNLIIASLMASS